MPNRPRITKAQLAEIALTARQPWRQNARCIGRASVMDPPRRKLSEAAYGHAAALCRGCPVLDECRTWVLSLPYGADPGGVCAGLTEGERARRRVTAKHCPSCERTLPGSAFHANNRHTDGLQTHCIDCTRVRLTLERNRT